MPPESSTSTSSVADDPGQQLAVGAAAEGGVEVDQVHPLRAVALPGQRGLERVAVGGLAAGLALDQAHGLAVGDVDGGEELQLRHAHSVGTAADAAGRDPSGRVAGVEFRDVVRRRRMVRDYDPDRPVPRRGAGAAARARHAGPSAGFSQGWAFLVLETPEERDRFWARHHRREASRDDGWLTRMRRAPLLVVPLSHKPAYLDRYAEPDKGWTDRDEARWPVPYWDIDTGMAALLMLLTAVDEGLGACFFGIPPRAAAGFRAAFGVPGGVHPDRLRRRSATPAPTTAGRRRCAGAGAASRRWCTVAAGEPSAAGGECSSPAARAASGGRSPGPSPAPGPGGGALGQLAGARRGGARRAARRGARARPGRPRRRRRGGAMVDEAAAGLGRLDVLVNNAGSLHRAPAADDLLRGVAGGLVAAPWRSTCVGAANATFCAVPHLIAAGGGAVVNVSSRGAFRGEPEQAGATEPRRPG